MLCQRKNLSDSQSFGQFLRSPWWGSSDQPIDSKEAHSGEHCNWFFSHYINNIEGDYTLLSLLSWMSIQNDIRLLCGAEIQYLDYLTSRITVASSLGIVFLDVHGIGLNDMVKQCMKHELFPPICFDARFQDTFWISCGYHQQFEYKW